MSVLPDGELLHLRAVPDLPVCPHCGSSHVKTFDPDWIEAPKGSWECENCGKAFVPEAWTSA